MSGTLGTTAGSNVRSGCLGKRATDRPRWGQTNNQGQLTPPPCVRFQAVAAGNAHSIGLAVYGSLYGWGLNTSGQTHVPQGQFVAIATKAHYSLGLRHHGTLLGWGSSPDGIFDQWTPDGSGHFYVADERFEAVAAGNRHALAIRRNGTVVGWGNNSGGALDMLDVPPRVRFKNVAAGLGYSVGLDTRGNLWGWGTPAPTPAPLASGPWTFEAAGWTRDDAGHYYVAGDTCDAERNPRLCSSEQPVARVRRYRRSSSKFERSPP